MVYANYLLQQKTIKLQHLFQNADYYLNDKNIKNAGDFIIQGYFKNRNILSNEKECQDENIDNVQNFRYKILK